MKTIIIEGTDNTGKDTIIRNLVNKYVSSKVVHCEKPTSDDPRKEQIESFTNLAKENVEYANKNEIEAYIHNRSWYGEYVYGCMYRGQDDFDVKTTVASLEDYMKSNINEDDIVLIVLLSDNADFLVKNDDGLSISEANRDKIIEETKRFTEIYDYSSLKNKHIVLVNDGDHFRTRESIWNQIETYLN